MSLDSIDTLSVANEGKNDNGSDTSFDQGKEVMAESDCSPWHYLFVHRMKLDAVNDKLKEKFNTFIHRSVIYKQEKNHVKKTESPTISGLIFVQGESREIQEFLKDNYMNIYLVSDCSTKKTATIPDKIMRPFMQISLVGENRIRFMPNPFEYYAKGNVPVRITSGVLAGLEGYRIRISRDRCFVTTVGNITIAINGVYKENFENIDEYVRHRKEEEEQQTDRKTAADVTFTAVQTEIDKCFFQPLTELDVIAIAGSLEPWIVKAQYALEEKRFEEGIEIASFILEETGNRFKALHTNRKAGTLKDILSVCRKADDILLSAMNHPDAPTDTKYRILSERESLAIRHSFLPIEIE